MLLPLVFLAVMGAGSIAAIQLRDGILTDGGGVRRLRRQPSPSADQLSNQLASNSLMPANLGGVGGPGAGGNLFGQNAAITTLIANPFSHLTVDPDTGMPSLVELVALQRAHFPLHPGVDIERFTKQFALRINQKREQQAALMASAARVATPSSRAMGSSSSPSIERAPLEQFGQQLVALQSEDGKSSQPSVDDSWIEALGVHPTQLSAFAQKQVAQLKAMQGAAAAAAAAAAAGSATVTGVPAIPAPDHSSSSSDHLIHKLVPEKIGAATSSGASSLFPSTTPTAASSFMPASSSATAVAHSTTGNNNGRLVNGVPAVSAELQQQQLAAWHQLQQQHAAAALWQQQQQQQAVAQQQFGGNPFPQLQPMQHRSMSAGRTGQRSPPAHEDENDDGDDDDDDWARRELLPARPTLLPEASRRVHRAEPGSTTVSSTVAAATTTDARTRKSGGAKDTESSREEEDDGDRDIVE